LDVQEQFLATEKIQINLSHSLSKDSTKIHQNSSKVQVLNYTPEGYADCKTVSILRLM